MCLEKERDTHTSVHVVCIRYMSGVRYRIFCLCELCLHSSLLRLPKLRRRCDMHFEIHDHSFPQMTLQKSFLVDKIGK